MTRGRAEPRNVCSGCHLCQRVPWPSQRGFSLPQVPPRGPGASRSRVGGGRAERSQPGPSCSMELPAPRLTSSPFTPAALLPGLNVSRSCTDEGWTHLEPGPYPIACGSNDKGSGSEEVGLSAPRPPGWLCSLHSLPLGGEVAIRVGGTPGACPPSLLPLQACIPEGLTGWGFCEDDSQQQKPKLHPPPRLGHPTASRELSTSPGDGKTDRHTLPVTCRGEAKV